MLAAGSPAPEVRLAPGVTTDRTGAGHPGEFRLRRFATGEYPVVTEGAPGETTTTLTVPRDKAPAYPWFLQVEAGQEARVCR